MLHILNPMALGSLTRLGPVTNRLEGKKLWGGEEKQEDPARAIPGQLVTGRPSNSQVTAVMTLPSDGG